MKTMLNMATDVVWVRVVQGSLGIYPGGVPGSGSDSTVRA